MVMLQDPDLLHDLLQASPPTASSPTFRAPKSNNNNNKDGEKPHHAGFPGSPSAINTPFSGTSALAPSYYVPHQSQKHYQYQYCPYLQPPPHSLSEKPQGLAIYSDNPPSPPAPPTAKAESSSVSTSSATVNIIPPPASTTVLYRKMPRRPSFFTIVGAVLTCVIFFYVVFPSSSSSHSNNNVAQALGSNIQSGEKFKAGVERTPAELTSMEDYDPIAALGKSDGPSQDLISGAPIMGHMTNETIRAEVGRAAWKLFHTILGKYSVKPTPQERETLSSYIYLFSRVYPCGQCAEHFQALLRQYPPQTSSREAASQWGCFLHNQVNERLEKEIFDCSTISEKYTCGCADDEKDGSEARIDSKSSDATDATNNAAANAVLKDLKLESTDGSPVVLEKGG